MSSEFTKLKKSENLILKGKATVTNNKLNM